MITQLGRDYGLNIILGMAPPNESNLNKLAKVFDIKHLHCAASNTNERLYNRVLKENGEEPDWLGPHMNVLEEQKEASSIPPDIDVQVIEVATESGYKPTLDTIIEALGIEDGYKLRSKPA